MVETRQAGQPGPLMGYLTAHIFRPAERRGALLGGSAAGLAIALGLALLVRSAFRGVSFVAFGGEVLGVVLVAIGALFLYWSYALYELRYVVDDDTLTIVWGLTRILIPVDGIERIVRGNRRGEPRVRGVSWPGCDVGRAEVARIGTVLFFSAHHSAEDIVYVSTSDLTFGISPGDARGFARAIQLAQESARSEARSPAVTYQLLPGQAILADRRALLMAGGALIAFLLAAGYIYARYPSLPLHLPLGFPPTNGPQRVGSRSELLILPITALFWLAAGYALAILTYARLRTVCYMILAGTVAVECLYAVAAAAAAH